MSDCICLSFRSKIGVNSNKRCKNKRLNGSLFCGKHKNSKKIYEIEEHFKETNSSIQPIREFSIIDLDSYIDNPKIINNLKIHNLKANLNLLNLNKKGKKNELIERLKNYFEKQLIIKNFEGEINVLEAFIKRKLIFDKYFKNLENRLLCINDTDYLFNENINEIPIDHFFSYNDNNFTYGFTVSSFNELIKWNCLLNPYNNQKIPESAIDMFNNRIKLMNKNNIKFNEYVEPILTEKEVIEQYAIDIFSRIDKLGNYSNHTWFTKLNMTSLIKYYTTLEDIWFYRAELTNEIRDKISNKIEVFTVKPNEIKTWTYKKKKNLQNLILKNCDILISSSNDIDDRKHAALLILTGLVDVSIEACEAHPLLAQALWGV